MRISIRMKTCDLAKFLRQRFKYYNRLVRARHDGFRYGDELVLLAENAQPWRLWLAAIQLHGSARQRLSAARLNLRDRNIELGAMAHTFLNYRENVCARKIRQEIFQADQAIREFTRLLRLCKFLERDGLFQ